MTSSSVNSSAVTNRSIFGNETFIYTIKRILQGILTLFLASLLSFLVIQLAPGDFLDTLSQNPNVSPETIETLKKLYGLDQPWYIQYGKWLMNIITRFDFGVSLLYTNRSVTGLLLERVYPTLLLAIASILMTWLMALPLGIISAVKKDSLLDKILRVFSYVGQGFPSFITALMLLLLAQSLTPLLPVGNMNSLNYDELGFFGKILDTLWHIILPTFALSIASFAGLQRLMRGQMLDVMRQEYIQTARAKGLPEKQVIIVHALRNAINPLITILGFEFASLLGGSFIAEFFFNWPGLGRLTLQAVQGQDKYLVMGSLMIGATLLIIGNLLADLLLKIVDPRIQLDND